MHSISPSKAHSTSQLQYEQKLYEQGYTLIAGVDEAGRGAWAGPVVAAAVIMPKDVRIYGVRDSKKVLPKKRVELAQKIKDGALSWAIGLVTHEEIDDIGIGPANKLAMMRAIQQLQIQPDHVLIDAFRLPDIAEDQQTAIIHGDALSYSIAAASIIAKVTRDQMMIEYDAEYPNYGFTQHKGYGTDVHRQALLAQGMSPIHRRSFQPMSTMV